MKAAWDAIAMPESIAPGFGISGAPEVALPRLAPPGVVQQQRRGSRSRPQRLPHARRRPPARSLAAQIIDVIPGEVET
jgi:hypothetical protein